MAARIIVATVCAAAVPFYVRFLVAMYKECRHLRICYLVRIQPDEVAIEEPIRRPKPVARAA